jgi:hypothetical protein
MRTTTFYLLSLTLCAFFTWSSCKKNNESTVSPEQISGFVLGGIFNNPVPNAKVSFNSQTVYTDDNGYFSFSKEGVSTGNHYIQVSADGYFPGGILHRIGEKKPDNVRITLMEQQQPVLFNANEQTELTFDGIKINIPAASVVLSDGALYNGICSLFVWNISQEYKRNILNTPGYSMMAIDKEGKTKILTSLGMLGAELRGANGEHLQIKPGQLVDVKIPIETYPLENAPEQVPTWHFNEQTGFWEEEGVATREENYYAFTVPHFSFWNVDIATDAILLKGKVLVDSTHLPLLSLKLYCEIDGIRRYSYGTCDQNGEFEGYIPANVPFSLELEHNCANFDNDYYNFPAQSTDFDLGTLKATNNDPNYTRMIEVQLVDCNNQPIPFGFARFFGESWINQEWKAPYHFIADQNGKLKIQFENCDNNDVTIEFFDPENGTTVMSTITILNNDIVTNLGKIQLCQ